MAKFRRRFKRATKKKRFFRKRTTSRKRKSSIQYDGMIKVKLQATSELNDGGITGVSTKTINWGNQINLANELAHVNIQDCPEWGRYSQLYKMFCVQGVKVEYKPYSFSTGTFDVISEELLVGSSRDGDTINSTAIRLAVDFHCQRANRNYKKYVGVAKDRMKNGSLEHD